VAIEAALRRLPLLPGADLGIALTTLAIVVRPAPPMRRPNAFVQGTEAMGRAEMRVVERQASALANALDELRSPQIDQLVRGGVDPIGAADLLRRMAEVARTGAAPRQLGKSGRGAPSKPRAGGITRVAAFHYTTLTGLEATYTRPTDTSAQRTPHGPFLGLLAVLFSLAGLDASPAAQVDKLRRDKPCKTD